MVGRRCDDYVNVVTFHHFAKVIKLRRCLAVFCKLRRGLIQMGLIDIADRQYLTKARRVAGVSATHSAATDQRDSGTVVWRQSFRL